MEIICTFVFVIQGSYKKITLQRQFQSDEELFFDIFTNFKYS